MPLPRSRRRSRSFAQSVGPATRRHASRDVGSHCRGAVSRPSAHIGPGSITHPPWMISFGTSNGTELDSHNVRRSFRGIVTAAGLDASPWPPREMRHSFVSLLSDSGVPLEHISRLVGQSGPARPLTGNRLHAGHGDAVPRSSGLFGSVEVRRELHISSTSVGQRVRVPYAFDFASNGRCGADVPGPPIVRRYSTSTNARPKPQLNGHRRVMEPDSRRRARRTAGRRGSRISSSCVAPLDVPDPVR